MLEILKCSYKGQDHNHSNEYHKYKLNVIY